MLEESSPGAMVADIQAEVEGVLPNPTHQGIQGGAGKHASGHAQVVVSSPGVEKGQHAAY